MLIIASASLALSAPTAHADTMYAGTGLAGGKLPANPIIQMLRRDNGQIVARLSLSISCRKVADSSMTVRLKGSTPDGASFTASGRSKLNKVGYVRATMTGTLTADAASGTIRVRNPGGCKGFTNSFSLRTESAPAGAPAVAGAGALMFGMSRQSTGGLRMAVSLRVAKNGRAYAFWQATMKCGKSRFPILDVTPTRKVKADGTFGGNQTYTIRYTDHSERYTVSFHGQFLADGARGTLRARMQWIQGTRKFVPCVSGSQTWTARG